MTSFIKNPSLGKVLETKAIRFLEKYYKIPCEVLSNFSSFNPTFISTLIFFHTKFMIISQY